MHSAIVVHYHEIALKGKNRAWFERLLIENIRWAIRDVSGVRIDRMSGRIVVRADGSRIAADQARIAHALRGVFGIANIGIGFEVRQDPATIATRVIEAARERLSADAQTFAVRVKRSNKSFPVSSGELERRIGAAIVDAFRLLVDLERPDVTVHVEIVERTCFVFTEKHEGPGGIPVGVSGNVLALLSSGFDSPVASWKMMKRGCVVDFLHFHSYPYTSDASLRNVEEIVRVLRPWQQGRGLLASASLIDFQKVVMTAAPAELRVLLYRRMMVRVADVFARAHSAEALVTGESIGQVASQTIPNMAVVGAASTLPMLRPLLGEDKRDIIAIAERIGTAEISARPYDDCCSLFTPAHPATRASRDAIAGAEDELDIERWTGAIVEHIVMGLSPNVAFVAKPVQVEYASLNKF